MQILITHGTLVRTRVLQFGRWQFVAIVTLVVASLLLLSGTIYHAIFLKAAREGWPVVSQIVRWVVRDEFARRDRFMRENLDAMARKVGEIQAKVNGLEVVGERVSGMVGINLEQTKRTVKPIPGRGGQGGPVVPSLSMDQLKVLVSELDELTDHNIDRFTLIESRLFEQRLSELMIPNSLPLNGRVGSGFGFRNDPFTGRMALHTGLDFPSEIGVPIMAAAGGVVRSVDFYPAYGNMLEIDHGNGLLTRYAHASKILVKTGDLVMRNQVVAEVGSSGRSTGPHLHFEVLTDGVMQDPARFLAGKGPARAITVMRADPAGH